MQMTSFVLLGVPEQFRLDPAAIEAGWKKAIAAVHPDRFADRSAAERRVAEQWAGRINEARDALVNPVSRACLLLSAAGIDVGRENDTRMPSDFLLQQMAWREVLEEAGDDAGKLAELQREVVSARDELISALTDSLDNAKDYEAARGQVRRLMFVEKLLTEMRHAAAKQAPAP